MKKHLFLRALCIAAMIIIWSDLNAKATSQTNPCIDCHSTETPRIVEQWEKSKHYINEVECQICHLAGVGDQSATEHHGFRITRDLTIAYCEGCHGFAYEEMEASRYKNGTYSHAPLK